MRVFKGTSLVTVFSACLLFAMISPTPTDAGKDDAVPPILVKPKPEIKGKPPSAISRQNPQSQSGGGGASQSLNESGAQAVTRGGKKVMTATVARTQAAKLGFSDAKGNVPSRIYSGNKPAFRNETIYRGKLPDSNSQVFLSRDRGGHKFDNGWKVYDKLGFFKAHGNNNLTKFVSR